MKLSDTATVLALASTAASNVVQIPVARSRAGAVQKRHPGLSKRATVTESLVNNATAGGYYATVSVGTPGQDLTLVLDTGSSDAWVVSADATLCTNERLQIYYDTTCGATFNASTSSTYKSSIPDGFTIQYADGSGASGDYFTDDFTIGDITVSDLQMGIADKTAMGTGILGIGFELNEAADMTYSNLVSTMVNQSKINTMAYSLYLNDYYSSTGSILFGGVDTEKFIGNLVTVPILPDAQSNNYSSFTVGLTGLSFAFGNGTTYNQSLTNEDNNLKSILDSGTTLSYLPDAIAIPLFEAVGAYQDTSFLDSTGLAIVDCNLDVEFTFQVNNSVTITVPKDELVIDGLQGASLSSDIPFASPCLFGIQNMGDSSSDVPGPSSARTADYALLGDSFLRSAYVVYDLENLQIGLAPANLNSTSTNVQELKAGESSLPAFSGVASQDASSGSGTSGSSGTASGTSAASGEASSSTGKSAAMGQGPPDVKGLFTVVGISLAFAISGSLLFWL